MSGCINSTRYLGKDEYLLFKKKIKGNENVPREELEALQRQKPNRRVLGYPIYVWFYYLGQNTSDKERFSRKIEKTTKKFSQKIEAESDPKKIAKLRAKRKRKLARLNKKLEEGSFFMQAIRPAAEKPVIFQEKLAQQTVDQMQLYMSSKGYFNSKASYSVDTLSRNRLKVTYSVEENEPHKLSEINYITEDSTISKIIHDNLKGSHLKGGENYDVQKLTSERERIEKLLRDQGYYYFNRQYIEFEYDSTVARTTSDSINNIIGKRRVDVDVLVHNPSEGVHKTYKIDSVYFILRENENVPATAPSSSFFRGLTYSYTRNNFSKRILNYKVFLRPGQLYSLQNTIETQRQLLNLDNFKFVNIAFDTVGGNFVTQITTSPANKFTTSEELGVSVSQRLPGPSINALFKNRNVFRGFENFETGVRYTFEGVVSGDQRFRSEEFTASASLVFPQTLFPFNTAFKRRLNRFNPKTRIVSSYTYINRPSFYERGNLRGSFIYTWQKGLYNYFSVSPIDISIVNTIREYESLKNNLIEWRQNGNPLQYSFQRAFISSINGFYTYNDYFPGVNKKAKYFNFTAESGGTIYNLIDTALIRKIDPNNNFSIFSYLRFSTDYRRYIPVGLKSTIAGRINVGFARPYLTKDKALPYEKYFFSGGGTSIRAWKPRQLGPGAFTNRYPDNPDSSTIYLENPGEILLEMNLEYRFNIVGIFDGAVFADAGNVWSYYENSLRPNAHFEWNRFYKEIAVGGGFGLRLNFNFFVVRVDAAYRVIDPAEAEGDRFVLGNVGKKEIRDVSGVMRKNPNRTPTIHFGVNYPF